MNTQNSGSPVARLSRSLMAGAALMVAAAATLWSPNVSAQPKANFSNGQTCNFTTFSYNATTQQLDIQCGTTTTPPPPPPPSNDTTPSTFSWSGGTTTSGTNGTFYLNRAGGSVGQAYTISFNVVGNFGGWNFLSASPAGGNTATVSFGANETAPKPFTFAPGSGSGSVWVSTTAISGTPDSAGPGVYKFEVTAPVVAQPVAGLPARCAAYPAPQHSETFSFGGQKHVFNLKPGEHAAVAFTSNAAGPQLSTTETVNTPANADHQVVVSDCPGDFTKAAPCAFESNFIGLSMNTTTGTPTGWSAYYQCPIPLGGRMFMNIRQVVKGNTGVNSCTQGACEVRAQIQNL